MGDHPVTTFLNWASAVSVLGTLLGWLPQIAAALGMFWYCILIYEYFWGRGRAR
jgi:hypothetical protein